ncbi:MAG: hypothetical protein QXU40_03940 [Candidatus Pacearchaeota archaeon]
MTKLSLLGALLIIVSVAMIGFINQSFKIDKFKKEGVEGKARIIKKYKTEKSKRWGNPTINTTSGRYSYIRKTDYYYDVILFKYEEVAQSKPSRFKLPNISALKGSFTTTIPVDKSIYDKYEVGEEIEIVYLKDNSVISKTMLNSLLYINPLVGIIITIIMFVSGVLLVILKK